MDKDTILKFVIAFDLVKSIHYAYNEYPVLRVDEDSTNKAANLILINEDMDNSKVLVVDDNESNQFIAEQIVISQGISCDSVSGGHEAIALLEKGNKYRFILMDIRMPVLDGYETTKIVKSKFPDQKVIALTAVPIEDNLQQITEANFDYVVRKPFRLEKLKIILEKF